MKGEKKLKDFKTLTITPGMLRELTVISKTEAGLPLYVKKSEDFREVAFAELNFWSLPVCKDSRLGLIPGNLIEKARIEITNKIDLEQFHNTPRPNMDWRKVPEDLIYKFLIYHEVGHNLCGTHPVDFIIMAGRGEITWEEYRIAIAVHEIWADKYAWQKLFPKKRVPTKWASPQFRQRVDNFMKKHSALFSKPHQKVEPLPIDDWAMVPLEHVKNGIPFVTEN
jgi:hypothetical protein